MSALAKLLINLLMAACIVTMLAFRLTGGELHEWMGVGLYVLFVIHCILNRNWFSIWNKGRYRFRRAMSSTVNVMLIICMVIVCVTGLMNSRFVLGFLELGGEMAARQIHSFSGYWGMVLVGIHAGIHWRKILVVICKIKRLDQNGIRWRGLRIAALIIASYGAWAFFDRDMGVNLPKLVPPEGRDFLG